MPKYRVTGPDGRSYEVEAPAGATEQQVIAYVQANAAKTPATRSGFIDDIQRGAGQALASIGSAARDVPIDAISRLGARAEQYGKEVAAANPADMPRVQDVRSVGDALTFAGERIAETIPQIVAPVAVGLLNPLAGMAVAGAGSLAQEYGGIRQEQRDAGIDEKGRAAAFAVPAAALDILGVGRVLPGAGRLIGDVVQTGVTGAVKTAGRVGAEEAVTEAAQTALERAGARQSLTDQAALDEYINAAAGGFAPGTAIGGGSSVARSIAGGVQNETPTPVTPTSPLPTEPGTPAGSTDVGVPSPDLPIPGVDIQDGGESVSVLVDGAPRQAFVTPEPDGNVVVEWDDGSIQTMPATDWDAVVSGGVPDVGPVTAPVQEPVVTEPTAPVAAPVQEPVVPDAVVAEPAPAQPEPAPITQADFDAADTPTAQFEAAVKGKTLPAVADYLATNATLPTVQRIMGRAAGVLRGLEKAGVKTEFGVSGQRPANFMSEVMSRRGSGVRGIGGVAFEGDGTPRAAAAIAGMRRANPGTQEVTTAHEIIHSITMSSIRNTASLPKDSRVRAAADGLWGLHKEVRAFYKSAPPEMRAGANDYRVKDPDELIAYGLTDYNFQQFLMRVPTKTGNAFTDFVQYIARLLGVPKGEMNALTRLIELSEDLIPVAATEVDAVIQGLKEMKPGASRRGDVASDLAEQRTEQRDSIDLPPESEIGTTAFREGRFGVDRFRRMWIDRFERLRQVESLGQLASASKSFYEAARRMNSVAAERIDKFRRDYFDPIQKVMRENGIDLNSVDWFLLASAAPQRNRRIEAKQRAAVVRELEAEQEKKYGDGDAAFDAEVDAAILAAYADGSITQSASGLTTAEAEAIVNDYMTGTKADAFRRIADLHRAAVKARMELAVQRGLISRPLADKLLREEPDYVPLKGRAAGENTRDAELDVPDADAESMMGYGGQGIAISGREWFDTQGRSTLPFSPFSTFISDTATSVIRGERNAVSQLLMQFMEANPIMGWKIFSATNPPRDANGKPRIPSPLEEDFLLTKRGGKTYWLRIPDPLTIRAARELSKAEMQPYLDKGVLKLARTMTRLLGRSFTTLQPSFFTVNYVRDIQAALLNVISEQQGGRLDGKKVAANFFKEATSKANFKALADFEFNRENPNSPQELRDLIEQWKIDGGTVSWIDRKTPQEVAAEMRADFAALNETEANPTKRVLQKGSRAFKAGVRALENANNVFEGMTRFAAYKAALDAGATREQAAMLSREITVDFQRAGETAQFMNNFYLFMNANIQGTARTLRSLKSPQVRAILGGAVATAATLAAYNAAVSGEDDDGELFWDKIPEYEKDRNLIIMNPNGGGIGVKIPMPYGFGFFTGIGTRLADAARRGDGMGKVAYLTLSSALTNFSPVQFAGDNLPSNIAAATVPTILKPVVDLWRNENFMSKPIYNEPFDSNQAKSSTPRYNTPEVYKWWAKTLNEIGGGEGKIKSPIGLDTPAEGWEYLVNFASGGVGNSAASLFVDSAKLAGVIDGKKDLGARDLPILRRFITEPAPGRNVGDYYENANNAATVQREMRDSEDKADFRKRHPVDTHPRVVAALTRSRSEIRSINEQRKALDKRDMSPEEKAERKAELKARVDAAYIRFNKVYNEVEKIAGL